jgi:hypothetical protein
MEAIRDWLEGNRDFGAGRALYEQHGDRAALKILFGQGESPFSRKKLAEALEALAKAGAPKPARDFFTQAPDGLKLAAPEAPVAPALGGVIERRKRLHNESRELHAQLRLMALDHADKYTNADRYAVQVRIFELREQIDECWAAERHFEKHGRLPEPPPPPVQPVVAQKPTDLRARLVTVRTYLTPSYARRLKPEKRAAYEAERVELERALAEAETGDA